MRAGKDDLGESYMMVDKRDRVDATWKMVRARLPALKSALQDSQHQGLKRAVLEVVASRVAASLAEIDTFVDFSLLAFQSPPSQARPKELLSLAWHRRADLSLNGVSVPAAGRQPQPGRSVPGAMFMSPSSPRLTLSCEVVALCIYDQVDNNFIERRDDGAVSPTLLGHVSCSPAPALSGV